MTQMTSEFPRAIARPVWLTARARNAVHRPIFIGAVGASAFIAALVALVLAPQQSRRVPRSVASSIARPDTTAFTAALAQARTRMGAAETSLEYSRSHPQAVAKPEIDTLTRALTARRDTLSSALSELDALLNRAEGAPLAASFRALAESPQLANSRAKALLDSLNDIERDREAFGSSGGADPVYVALTSRAAEIGRAIQAVGQERRDVLRQQISKLIAPAPRQTVAQAPIADTAAWISERDSARSVVVQATAALAAARTKAQEYDREESRANSIARLDASPVALLAAALVFGVALGFGSAFLDEMRHPRVSDEHELERVTGARVLSTIRPRPPQPERRRRQADRDAPPYFDPGADGYQLTYLHVARTGASRLMLTIAGADTGVAAVVGVNVAAIAADEARSTIIIDTDSRTSPVAAALRTHAEPGIADIMDRRLNWPEVTSQATVGRDRVIDVLPSGITLHAPNTSDVTELFRREGGRMARHYEAIVVVTSLEQAVAGLPGALPIHDTVICARIGQTRIADLQRALDSIRAAGGNPLGIVLWDAPPPALPTPERVAAAPRPLRTAEMKAITSAR